MGMDKMAQRNRKLAKIINMINKYSTNISCGVNTLIFTEDETIPKIILDIKTGWIPGIYLFEGEDKQDTKAEKLTEYIIEKGLGTVKRTTPDKTLNYKQPILYMWKLDRQAIRLHKV